MTNQDRVDRITRSYEKHPLNADAILDRVRRQRGTLSDLTELDLAIDHETLITDQNHTGGYNGVLSLAATLHLQGKERVLDVGAGLGGTTRVLAHAFGCDCHGVELTPARFEDCQKLTRLVKLEKRCAFSCGDFLEIDIPGSSFDIVIGQDTFMHFPDQRELLQRCADLLHAGGRLVVEEGYIRKPPEEADSISRLQQAWDHWNGEFHTLAQWTDSLRSAGFHIEVTNDLTNAALDEYEAQLKREAPHADRREVEGWRLGRDLMKEGLLGVIRLVCKKTD